MPPPLYQIAALAMIYGRFTKISAIGPILVLVTPVALRLTLLVLNLATGGYGGVACVLMTIVATTAFLAVRKFASSTEEYNKALNANLSNWRYALLFVVLVTRFVVAPIAQRLPGWTDSTTSLTSYLPVGLLSFSQSSWLAGILLLLDAAVLARYVGKVSIARCSTVPLSANPIYSLIQERDLLSLVRPNEYPGSLDVNLSPTNSAVGRRYQYPTFIATFRHAFVVVCLGALLSVLLDLQWYQSYRIEFWRLEVFVASLATLFGSLPNILFHELDPKQYLSKNNESEWEFARKLLWETTRTTFWVVLSVVGLFGSKAWTTTDSTFSSHPGGTVGLFCACMSMSIYLQILDRSCRTSLFTPLAVVRDLVERHVEYDGTAVPYVTVLVQSILRYSHAAASTVLGRTRINPVSFGQWDQEELQHTVALGNDVAQYMVWHQRSDQSEAPLEEDILQFTVLASLADKSNDSVAGLTKPSPRRAPMIVPLVRALCVFLYGFVSALRYCYHGRFLPPLGFGSVPRASDTGTAMPPRNRIHNNTWALPPGLLCAVELALQGLARCIVESCLATSPSDKTIQEGTVDWKASCLALVIPTCLETMHAVRVTVMEYRGSAAAEHEDSRLSLVLKACDDAALDVLKCITPVNITLQPDTLEWVKEVRRKAVVVADHPTHKID